jgi:CBS domain-containing protein
MRAADVMTTDVITVAPETSVRDLAALLGARGISGVPVVNAAGQLVGIASEGDLLHRAETGTGRPAERRRAWWLDSLAVARDLAQDYVKSHGRTVGDVMTRAVATVTEDTGLDAIAHLLETKRIKRVPVLRDGKVVGIVSRSNLVRALTATETRPDAATDADDRTIRESLLDELRQQKWARVWPADVIVRDKTVHLWCSDDRSEEEVQALRVAAANTAGVQGVEVHIVHVPLIPAF